MCTKKKKSFGTEDFQNFLTEMVLLSMAAPHPFLSPAKEKRRAMSGKVYLV